MGSPPLLGERLCGRRSTVDVLAGGSSRFFYGRILGKQGENAVGALDLGQYVRIGIPLRET
ncbi:hypothetical protein [Allochromatium palmeri]|uniref:Uncharacterized protein n=1 Tax=Allochromatium palmeri TaxID=231048 RepID=A0A6N8E9R2_9GAMM|nr:hypothetical protein [Allochromatium palmeri]MTW21033.1 hypothetical protein [Allochromatium palmeri]